MCLSRPKSTVMQRERESEKDKRSKKDKRSNTIERERVRERVDKWEGDREGE